MFYDIHCKYISIQIFDLLLRTKYSDWFGLGCFDVSQTIGSCDCYPPPDGLDGLLLAVHNHQQGDDGDDVDCDDDDSHQQGVPKK